MPGRRRRSQGRSRPKPPRRRGTPQRRDDDTGWTISLPPPEPRRRERSSSTTGRVARSNATTGFARSRCSGTAAPCHPRMAPRLTAGRTWVRVTVPPGPRPQRRAVGAESGSGTGTGCPLHVGQAKTTSRDALGCEGDSFGGALSAVGPDDVGVVSLGASGPGQARRRRRPRARWPGRRTVAGSSRRRSQRRCGRSSARP